MSKRSENALKTFPPISVLICTRNRPDDLIQTMPDVMAQDYPNFEVIVVDQSTNDESEQRVKTRFGGDARLRYIRSDTVGLSVSRNLALMEARHELCAFTDDDCGLPPNWLANIAAIYTAHPETHVLFSPVHKPREMEHRTDLMFPTFYFTETRVLAPGEIQGMGANMSLRKSFWERVGPFDAQLGAGSPQPGGEEFDWLYRAQLHGAKIRLDASNPIRHRAWRDYEQWMRVTRAYARGDSAFAMKHLRCGDLRLLGKVLHSLFYIGARGALRVLQRDAGWRYEYNYVCGYWSGLWSSLKLPIDRPNRLYITPPPTGRGQSAATPERPCPSEVRKAG